MSSLQEELHEYRTGASNYPGWVARLRRVVTTVAVWHCAKKTGFAVVCSLVLYLSGVAEWFGIGSAVNVAIMGVLLWATAPGASLALSAWLCLGATIGLGGTLAVGFVASWQNGLLFFLGGLFFNLLFHWMGALFPITALCSSSPASQLSSLLSASSPFRNTTSLPSSPSPRLVSWLP
jgi:hypothetical protein